MRQAIRTIAAVLALIASGSARANDLSTANTAFDHADYAKAFDLYQPLARAGDPSAQSAMGALYYFGNGVQKNLARAYMWFSVAAQSAAPVATVAKTNRDLVREQLAPGDIEKADALADACIRSRFEECGVSLFAAR